MRKRIVILIIAALLVTLMGHPLGKAAEEGDQPAQMELTEKQQKELSKLYESMFKKKKKIISKYVEYGVMDKAKGERIISQMEKHLQHIKDHGYLPAKYQKHCNEKEAIPHMEQEKLEDGR